MDYAVARHNMVESQIRTNRVTDPAIVDAMADLPRELFVPKELRGVAYVDEDLHIGGGRYLMEPMVLGRLLQLAAIRPNDLVLSVGSGSGYAAAVLARLAHAVVAVEEDAGLRARAGATLDELGIHNVAVVEGALNAGYPQQAPFDVIFFDGAVEEVPQAIVDQLAEGGRLVAVIHPSAGMGQATLMVRAGKALSARVAFDAATPVLPGLQRRQTFIF